MIYLHLKDCETGNKHVIFQEVEDKFLMVQCPTTRYLKNSIAKLTL